jgi:hypothetical protein
MASAVAWRRVERRTSRGRRYATYERIMPRIPDQLLNSVVYLFQDEAHALSGEGAGGTGFLIDYLDEQAELSSYVVSNLHVVGSGCTTVRINTKDGGVEPLEIPRKDWADHPDGDDVSVAPIYLEEPSEWAVEPLSWENFCPTPERLEELNAGLGDEVLMLGRFSGHSGRQQNQPLARFGNLAMMDEEKIRDGRGMLVDAYLVEMRSLPGFSGSPVFLCIGGGSYRGLGPDNRPRMMPFNTETIGLLGIDTGHKNVVTPVRDKTGKEVTPARVIQQNSGVAIVAPYYKIKDVLEGDDLVKQREQAGEDALADPERGVSDIAPDDDGGEFERFEDLTRKLVKTPKPKPEKPED